MLKPPYKWRDKDGKVRQSMSLDNVPQFAAHRFAEEMRKKRKRLASVRRKREARALELRAIKSE